MAEANGNGQKLENAVLTLAARWFTVIGFPAMFALSMWFGSKFVERIDTFISEARTEFRNNDQRMNGLDIRLTGAERDIKYLQDRQ
jgi:hypothetical protein